MRKGLRTLLGRLRPPTPPRSPDPQGVFGLQQHGRSLSDPFKWMEKGRPPALEEYVNEEARYFKEWQAFRHDNIHKAYRSIRAMIPETTHDEPEKIGDFLYFTRTNPGSDLPTHYRKPIDGGSEELLLDLERESAGKNFCNLHRIEISECQSRLLYCIDFDGCEEYEIRVRCLKTGVTLASAGPGMSVEWCTNDSFVYSAFGPGHLPYQIRHHVIGRPQSQDEVLLETRDPSSIVDVSRTKDKALLMLSELSRDQIEVSVVPTPDALSLPRVVRPRKPGVTYSVEHAEGWLYLVTNEYSDPHHQVYRARLPTTSGQDLEWEMVVEDMKGRLIEDMDIVKGFLLLYQRARGLPSLQVSRLDDLTTHFAPLPQSPHDLSPGINKEFSSTCLRVLVSDPVHPTETLEYNPDTNTFNPLHIDQIMGSYRHADYVCKTMSAPTTDGVSVPLSIAHRRNVKLTPSTPLLIHTYGAYGAPTRLAYRPELITLADKGWVLAWAHVRGSGDCGLEWYHAGRQLQKQNSMRDLVACVEHLHRQRISSSQFTCSVGASAGSVTVASAALTHPHLFKGIILKAPFLDVLTAMCSPDHPLTQLEYSEWGNPSSCPQVFDYIASYCPYRLSLASEAKSLPAMLIMAAQDDARVPVWHAIKFTAQQRRLRETMFGKAPVYLHCPPLGGHLGAQGQIGRLEDVSLEIGFLDECLER